MAITNFNAIANSQWIAIQSQYTAITPSVAPSGTTNPNLAASWYVKSNDSTAFVLMLQMSGNQAVSTSNSETADQLNAVCAINANGPSTLYYYYTLNESQGWSDRFNVALEITNTNSQKGKLVFTKSKGQHPGKKEKKIEQDN